MTLEEQLAEQAKRGLLGLGLEQETAEQYAPWASLLAQFIPGVGEGVGVDNTVDAINDERYGDAAIEGGLTLLGAVPVVGDFAAAAIKGIRKAPVKAFDEAAWLKDNPRPEGGHNPKSANYNPETRSWYHKLYRKRNEQKLREKQAAYYQENRAEKLEYARNHRIENNDAVTARQRARYARDPDPAKAYQVGYREKNAEAIKAAQMAYRDADRAGWNARGSASRAEREKRVVPWSSRDKIKEIYETALEISEATGVPHEVDHVMPLQGGSVSGLHHQDNLLIVPRAANRSKSNKFEPGDLPPRAGVRKSRAYLKKIREELGLLGLE